MTGSDDDLIERYFLGDLDTIESEELERRLESSGELRRKFDAKYDSRSAEFGFFSLQPSNPDLAECFSPLTLEKYAKGQLSPAENTLVADHVLCPFCAEHIRGFRALHEEKMKVPSPFERMRSFFATRQLLLVPVAAAIALIVVLPWRSEEKETFRSADACSISHLVERPSENSFRLLVSAKSQEPCFVGVRLDERWIEPEVSGLLPPELVELAPGGSLRIELTGAKIDSPLSIVVSEIRHSVATIDKVLPEFKQGDWTLGIEGRPKVINRTIVTELR